MAAPERAASLDVLRDAMRAHASRVTQRVAAADVGMSVGGLHNFLMGGDVRPGTLRKLQAWYVRTRAELGEGDSPDAIRAALALILEPVPSKSRERVRGEVLDAVERACKNSGAPVPDWVRVVRGWSSTISTTD